jgi:aspartate carbamoyltransferase regulatory subunit
MRKKKRKLRMAENYFVNHVDEEIGRKAVKEVHEEITSMTCTNDDCFNWKHEKDESKFGIKDFGELNGKCSIAFTSSKWCCNQHMKNVHSKCFSVLRKYFSSDDVVSRPNHFYQE